MSHLEERTVERVRESIPARVAAALFWAVVRGVPTVARMIRRKERP